MSQTTIVILMAIFGIFEGIFALFYINTDRHNLKDKTKAILLAGICFATITIVAMLNILIRQ
jgi:hypothetical protein